MKVKELIAFLVELAEHGCGNAHVVAYDPDLEMPAIVHGAVYNEHVVELSTETKD